MYLLSKVETLTLVTPNPVAKEKLSETGVKNETSPVRHSRSTWEDNEVKQFSKIERTKRFRFKVKQKSPEDETKTSAVLSPDPKSIVVQRRE